MTGADQPRRHATLLLTAAVLLVGGGGAWVFPGAITRLVGEWVLPGVSIAALLAATWLASPWRALQLSLAVFAVALFVGWAKVPGSASAAVHMAGASLGLLLMVVVGQVVVLERHLKCAVGVFLALGIVVLFVGLAGTDVGTLGPFGTLLASVIPAVRLGLAGLDRGQVNPNGLAAAALLIAPLGAAIAFTKSKPGPGSVALRSLGVAGFAVGAFMLLLSGSRTAGMAAWLMMVVILMRGLRPVALRIVTGLTVVVPPLVGISALSVLTRERFLLEAGFLWSTLDTRVQLMTSGVRLWAESPWFGIGLNQFRHVHKQRGTWAAWAESPSLWGLIPTPDYLTWPAAATDVAHAHNTLLQTALDTGVIGLAAYLGILAFLLVQAARASRSSQVLCRRVALGSFLSLVAVTAFGLADALALGSKIGAFQWMAAGLILGALRVQSDTNGHAPRRR